MTASRLWLRDAVSVPRVMALQVLCLLPAWLWACYAIGRQSLRVMAANEIAPAESWRQDLIGALTRYDAGSIWDAWCYGAVYLLPLTIAIGATCWAWETGLARWRQRRTHPEWLLHAGFLLLLMPASLPLAWALLAASAAMLLREISGGPGRYRIQPAVAGWLVLAGVLALRSEMGVLPLEGSVYGTLLQVARIEGFVVIAPHFSWWESLWGLLPAQIGATATPYLALAALALFGAGLRLWRPPAATLIGLIAGVIGVHLLRGNLPIDSLPWYWHLSLGNTALIALLLASDSVTAPISRAGQWSVGLVIGIIAALLRLYTPLVEQALPIALIVGNALTPALNRLGSQRAIRLRAARIKAAAAIDPLHPA